MNRPLRVLLSPIICLSIMGVCGCTVTIHSDTPHKTTWQADGATITISTSEGRTFTMSDPHAERTEEKTVDATKLNSLTVRGDFGGIRIEPTTNDRETHIKARKTVSGKGYTVAQLEELANRVTLKTETHQGVLEVSTITPKDFPNKVSVGVEFLVGAPKRLNLDLKTDNGEIMVKGTGNHVRAVSDFGAVTIIGGGGDIEARTENGAIVVENAPGAKKVTAHSDFGSVTVRQAQGVIEAITDNGTVTLENIPNAPQIVAKSNFGSVTLRNVGGNIDAKTDNGSITVDKAMVPATVTLASGFGAVRATGIKTNSSSLKVHLASENGQVHFAGDASELLLRSDFGSVEAELTTHLALRSGEVQTENGGITLHLPTSFAAHLDAHTENGSIHTEGFSTTRLTKDGGSQSVSTTLNGGNAPLNVRSNFGSITVHM